VRGIRQVVETVPRFWAWATPALAADGYRDYDDDNYRPIIGTGNVHAGQPKSCPVFVA
jgi:hypothetical protein